MTILLYQTNSAREIVSKSLTYIGTYEVKPQSDYNVQELHVLVSDFSENANYAFLSDFNRYYYIESYTRVGQLWELHLVCDVLMSHWNTFKTNIAIIERQESNGNAYIDDAEWTITAKNNVITRLFPNPVGDTTSLIMTVIGGATGQ